MRQYKGYLLDLDGTMYRGNEPIESAIKFVQELARKHIPYLFVTNNSSKTPETIVEKLLGLDVPVEIDQVMTSSIATAKYISGQDDQASCFVIGEQGLKTALETEGLTLSDNRATYVVMGIDREINYDKLTKASLFVQSGAQFISTNSDRAIPTEQGLVPGNGALTAVVAKSSGIEPTFIGKPTKIIMEQSLRKLGLNKDEVIMVGDNYQTDIKAGINNGIDTLMVFTGVTPLSAYDELPVKPTFYNKNLSNWIRYL